MKILLVIGSLLAAVVVAGAGVAAFDFYRFLNAPVAVRGGVEFDIPPGSSLHAVSDELRAAGVVGRPGLFRAYARWKGAAGAIQAGHYRIEEGTTPARLLEQFTNGDVQLFSFTLIEGWNRWELLAALQGHPEVRSTLSDADWPSFLADLGAERTNPEGLFFPETYRFPRATTDRSILGQAYRFMQKVLAEEWSARAEGLPLESPYEALTLASIVEKETARPDERARIAGVFVRRLEERMRLATDPTVIYGIGTVFDGNLTRRDLQTDTPYNTYTRGGLPPTPIAMPGRASIHAALHPAPGDALYFVATGLGDGSHAFSATKEQHDAAVAEYLRRLRGRRP